MSYRTGTSTSCLHTKFVCLVIFFSLKCLFNLIYVLLTKHPILQNDFSLSRVNPEKHFSKTRNTPSVDQNPPKPQSRNRICSLKCSVRWHHLQTSKSTHPSTIRISEPLPVSAYSCISSVQPGGRCSKDQLLNIYKLTKIRETVSQPQKQNKPETNLSPTDFQSRSLHPSSVWDCPNVFRVSCSQAET